MQDRQRA